MSDSEHLEQDWICNNPTKNEIRFNDDSDFISSNDSDAEQSNSVLLKKYNQLLPRGKSVHKLLQLTKPAFNKIWKVVDITEDLQKKLTEDNILFNHHSNDFRSDDSDNDEVHFRVAKENNQSESTCKRVVKSLNSARRKGNATWKTVNNKVDLQKNTDSDLETVSSEIMAKSHKRKREESASEEQEASVFKKIKSNDNKSISKKVKRKEISHNVSASENEDSDGNSIKIQSKRLKSANQPGPNENKSISKKVKSKEISHNVSASENEDSDGNSTKIQNKRHKSANQPGPNENKSISKKVKRKEISHNVSASENEDSDGNSTKIQSKRHKSVNQPDGNVLNTHLLSSESDNGADLSYDFTASNATSKNAASENGEVSDSERESVENSQEESNHVDNNVTVTTVTTESWNKLHRIPKFTSELDEEVSKFSLLLDENLIEKNNIWILQCPSNMDCSALVSQRLSLGGSCQLTDGDRTYETYSYRNTHARSATIAVPSEHNKLNLRRIPISGNIIVEESVKAVNNVRTDEIILETPSRVEFPENLRVRHPLLGINFSKQARTVERIAENVPKKKKHSKKHEESYNGLILSDMGSPSTPTPSKKKKKNKHRSHEDITMSDHEGNLEVIDSAVKKKKKKKHKDNDSVN